jgi:hypothetical protein
MACRCRRDSRSALTGGSVRIQYATVETVAVVTGDRLGCFVSLFA